MRSNGCGVDFGDFGAEKPNLVKYVDPEKNNHKRPSGARDCCNLESLNVPAENVIDHGEGNARQYRRQSHVSPMDFSVWKNLVNYREKQRG